jgi:L-alanine-DL-glutamate epimerase-like enolase superfamily enzyme
MFSTIGVPDRCVNLCWKIAAKIGPEPHVTNDFVHHGGIRIVAHSVYVGPADAEMLSFELAESVLRHGRLTGPARSKNKDVVASIQRRRRELRGQMVNLALAMVEVAWHELRAKRSGVGDHSVSDSYQIVT